MNLTVADDAYDDERVHQSILMVGDNDGGRLGLRYIFNAIYSLNPMKSGNSRAHQLKRQTIPPVAALNRWFMKGLLLVLVGQGIACFSG